MIKYRIPTTTVPYSTATVDSIRPSSLINHLIFPFSIDNAAKWPACEPINTTLVRKKD